MTYRDLITAALRSIGVIHTGETPSAEEANNGLDACNEMLNSWIYEGIDLEHTTETDLNAAVPYPDDHLGPIRWNLAARLCPEFGIAVSQEVGTFAGQGFAQLQREYADPDTLTIDSALSASFAPNIYI